MNNVLGSFNDKKEINHLCLMANEQLSGPNSSNNDDDINKSEVEEEEEV